MSRVIGTIKDKDTGINIDITEEDDGSVVFAAGATIDGDGASGQVGEPPCYAPSSYQGHTLDVLANAGHPGNWYGVVTEGGTPIVQTQNDPCPGAYVSATALFLPDKNGAPLPDRSPYKYVDSATVPFIAVPPMIIQEVKGVVLGCRCIVTGAASPTLALSPRIACRLAFAASDSYWPERGPARDGLSCCTTCVSSCARTGF